MTSSSQRLRSFDEDFSMVKEQPLLLAPLGPILLYRRFIPVLRSFQYQDQHSNDVPFKHNASNQSIPESFDPHCWKSYHRNYKETCAYPDMGIVQASQKRLDIKIWRIICARILFRDSCFYEVQFFIKFFLIVKKKRKYYSYQSRNVDFAGYRYAGSNIGS